MSVLSFCDSHCTSRQGVVTLYSAVCLISFHCLKTFLKVCYHCVCGGGAAAVHLWPLEANSVGPKQQFHCHLACRPSTFLSPEWHLPGCTWYPKSWDSLSVEVLVVGVWCPCRSVAPIHSQSLWMQPALCCVSCSSPLPAESRCSWLEGGGEGRFLIAPCC